MLSQKTQMAEVISEDNEAVTLKPGCHSRFTSGQDLVIAREVAAAEAHTSSYAETKKRFEAAAMKVKANAAFNDTPVAWKEVQDRYKRVQDQYGQMDDGNQRLSGVRGEEMGELADLFRKMREAREDWESQKKSVRTAEKKKKGDKQRMEEALMSAATARRSNTSSDEDQGGSGSSIPDNGEEKSTTEVEIVDVEQLGSAQKKRRKQRN